jgi:hypothetical protein
MSYCRWSSDDWKSDVYTYAHVDGSWTTHVAGRKRVGHITPLPDYDKVSHDEWWFAYQQQMKDLEKTTLVDIGLPHDGETFKDDSPQSCAATLRRLREAGYHVPDGVIEELEREEPEMASS